MRKSLVRGIVMALCVGLLAPTAAVMVPGMEVEAETEDKASKNDIIAGVLALQAHKATLDLTSSQRAEVEDILKKAYAELKYNVQTKTAEEPTDTPYASLVVLNAYIEKVKAEMTAVTKLSGNNDNEEEEPYIPPDADHFLMVGGSWVTPVANAGQAVSVVLPVVNMGKTLVTDAVVTPVLSTNTAEWPFEITSSNYSQTIEDLPGTDTGMSDMDRRRELTWNLTTRSDVGSGYQKLSFDVRYRASDGTSQTTTLDTYVQVNGTAGIGADGQASVPRVIVTGFETNPETVHAGESFMLTLHLKNTSTATSVSNMIFEIVAAAEGTDGDTTYAAFLPTAGSSTIFVDKIGKNGTKDIQIEMEAKADLAQKPYAVNVNMSYEDEHVNSYTNTTSVSIPVKQEARVDISEPEVMPPNIEVGGESNIMFSIYNMGKTKLYNVQVKTAADSVSGGDAFVGNLDPGATGSVDIYVMGQAATMDDGTVTLQISYEDETGEATVIEKTITLFVNEPMMDDFTGDDMMMDEMPQEGGGPMKYILTIAAVLVVAAAAAAVVFFKRKKKKARQQLEADLIDLDTEDDTDDNE